MTEQLKQSEREGNSLKLQQDIASFEDIINEAEQAPAKDLKDRLSYIRIFTGNLFKNNPGKWSEEEVQSVYSLAKRVGVLGAGDNVVTATEYVRSVIKELAKKSTDASFKAKLKYETTHFSFSRQIDYSWLEESALNELNSTNKMLYDWGKTVTPDNFEHVFSNLIDSWLDQYVQKVLTKAPNGTEKNVAFARGKIKANLAFNFYAGLIPNPKIGSADKKKVLDLNVAIVDKMPGLFGEKRTLVAEATAAQLGGKKGKVGEKGERKFRGPRTTSERVSEREHKGVSVASVNSDDVVLFDYKESAEVQLEMPDTMKVQLNSIALIHDLAAMLLKGGKIDLAISNRVTAYLNNLQNDLVEYYKGEDYDGKTPFDLEKELLPIMSGNRFKEFVNATNKIALSPARTGKMGYRAEFLKLLSGKSLADMDEVKKAGFAIAWMERHVFEDHMSARGLMSKLLHKDIMAAREKLSSDVKEKLYETAYNDARRSITSMLSDGKTRENFRANFKIRFLKDNFKSPTDSQIDEAYGRFFSSLFESQHKSLYDNYLTLAAFSDKHMKAPVSGVDKAIYDEFCDSTDPNNDFFKLGDEGRAVLSGVAKEVAIMAVAMLLTAGVGIAARAAATAVRGLSMMKNAGTIARYAVEAAMYTGTVTAEAGAFYDTNAFLHGEATIAGTALVDHEWAKAGTMLASEMPMFALLGGAHYAAGFAKMGMSGEAKALMASAKKYPKSANEIKNVLELAKSSPKKAIQAMGNALAKGELPKEIAQRYARVVDDVGLLAGRYRGVLGKISDPFAQKAIGVLVVDLNFDAAAIMLGTYLKEKIHPTDGSEAISAEERGAIEAVLLEWGKSYLMAAGFKTAFGAVGKLAKKVPAVLERVLSQGLREKLIGTYKNAKGEFIGRDGLINMLKSDLEVGGFDTAIAQMEEAKVLILTVKDVLLVTSELPEGKAKKFLETCKRMMKPAERQLVVDEVTAMQKSSVLPEGFARGRSDMPMDRFRNAEGFVGKLITAKILGLVLRVFSPEVAAEPVERPVAEATVKPGDFAPEGRFNLSKERVAKMPKASEKSKVSLINSGAKTPEEAFKDFSNFDFSVPQSSIFDGMKKAGVNAKEIASMEAAYASLPDFLKPYYRVLGANVDGQFVQRIAIDNEGFAKQVGYSSGDGSVDSKKSEQFVNNLQTAGLIDGLTNIVGKVIGTLAEKGIELSTKAIFSIIASNITSPKGIYGISVMIAYVYFLTKGKGKWGSLPLSLVWPLFPILKKVKALRLEEDVESKPLKTLQEIISDLHLDGIEPKNHYGLSHNDHMQLVNSYNALKPFFETLKGGHDLFTKVIQALFLKLRLKNIHERLHAISGRRHAINDEIFVERGKIDARKGDIAVEKGNKQSGVDSKQEDIENLKKWVSLLKGRSLHLQERNISRINQNIASLLRDIQSLESRIEQLSAEIKKIERERNAKVEERKMKNTEMSQLRSSLDTSDTIVGLQDKIAALEQDIASTKSSQDLQRKELELSRMKSELRKLRRINDLTVEINTLNQEISRADSDFDGKNREVDTISRQKKAHESELAQRLQDQIDEMEGNIRKLEKDKTKLEEEIKKLDDESNGKLVPEDNKTISDAKKKIEALEAEIKKLNEETGKLHDEEHGLDATLNDPLNGLLYQIITDGWKFNVDKKLRKIDVRNSITKVLTDNGMPDREARQIADAIIDIVNVLMIHPKSSKLRDLERSDKLIEGLRETDDRASGLVPDSMATAMNQAYQALQRSQSEVDRSMGPLAKSWRFIDSLLPHNSAGRKLVAGILVMLLGAGYYYANSKGLIGPAPSPSSSKPSAPKLPPAPGTTSSPADSPSERRKVEESPVSGIDPRVGPAIPAPSSQPDAKPQASKEKEKTKSGGFTGTDAIKERLRKVGKLK